MTYEDLHSTVHRQPFEPFRLVLTTGEAHEIRHPDLIMVGRRSAILGLTKNPDATAYDKGTITVDLLHIVAIQNLAVKPPSDYGPAA